MNWKNDFAQTLRFLRNQGKFGFITSSTWLDVGYGSGLKKFFLDNFRILLLVEFDYGVFGDALANKCVCLLEKEEDPLKRDKNLVRFVTLKRITKISKIIKTLFSVESDQESEEIRIVVKPQIALAAYHKWRARARAKLSQKNTKTQKENLKISGPVGQCGFGDAC